MPRARARAALPALLAAAGLAAAAGPATAAINGKLAFTSKLDGNTNLFSQPTPSGAWTRLTTNAGEDAQAAWSPDGTRIAFRSIRDGRYYEVYVMNADGTGQRALTVTPTPPTGARPYSSQPAWSPDGARIVFRSNRDGDADIYTMSADGTDVRQVADMAGDERYPSFSPDGSQILFQSNADGDRDIYVMNADGSGRRQLTVNDVIFDSAPMWSPDGREIAFERMDAETSQTSGAIHDSGEIHVMDAAGGNVRRLTTNAVHDEGPAWSPDGQSLVFTSEREDPAGDIWVMGADGAGARKVAGSAAIEESPDWQPLAGLPTAPARLSATTQTQLRIHLSWTAATSPVGVVRYEIRRSTFANDPNAPVRAVVDAATTAYTDGNLTNGVRYHYTVRAIDRATTSGPASPEASAVARKK